VADELRRQGVTVIEYELGSRARLFSDVRALRRIDADVYHVTGDVNYIVFLLPWSRTILTVHDIGHFLFGLQGWRRRLYKWLWLVGPMRLARQVTAVSEATRSHIAERLAFPSERIRVIENCYKPIFQPAPLDFNATCPRILQVGTRPYKNVPRLIRALQNIPCRLVLIGELDSEITAALDETGVSFENRAGLSQQDLHQEYAAADLVTFVSVGEGFGVPIIEAQAMARPLITGNVPPMSVVAGAGACLADPLDIESIREGILRLISDDRYREQVIAEGLKNAVRYSPGVVASAYLKAYQGILPR